MSNSNTIDINLYDRQVRTYGVEAVKKMTTSSVLIMGLGCGLGTEVGKNLALGGIKNIYLFDPSEVTSSDLETGFYYSKQDIGNGRAQVLQPKLQELNPYVNVQVVSDFKQGQNVTIVINQDVGTVTNQVSKFCRETNSKLVVLYSKGVSGAVFVDAGESHCVSDVTGETIDPVQIGEITTDGKVRCAPHASHDFQSGDYIQFGNLEGTNVEQFDKEWKIKVINKLTFQLEGWENVEPFTFINGTAIHVKKPVEISHQTWELQLQNPSLAFSFDMDYSKKLVDTYLQMFTNEVINSMPSTWSESNKYFMETNKIALPEQARLFQYEFMPVVSLMGSIAASEAIKLVTNKYLPINQWFTWNDSTLVPTTEPTGWQDAKTAYGKVWGLEFENKLINSKWFMVGSGAIGCEHLKNLAFMGVADRELGSDGEIIVTDPDSIEKSNLNRQFLFRSQHIGKPKSVTAAQAVRQMKPHMAIRSDLQKVGSDNLEFTNQIMDSGLTGVLNALDNIRARRFMDEQCFKFGLPLFESGTTGTKGNTQPVVPFVTETYSNSSDPEQEKSFPICTIKSFPNEIAHTIHWAMDQFEFFNRAPAVMNKWIRNPQSLNELNQIEKSTAMEDINQYTIKYPTQKLGLVGCAHWAVDMFMENYHNSIVQLLHAFPPTKELSPGVLFWSAGKRCPKPIVFDVTNSDHMDYVEATTHLIARTSGIPDNFTRVDLVKMVQDYQPKQFVPKEMEIAANDSELEKVGSSKSGDYAEIGYPTEFEPKYVPQDFEKDDDSNWHISWVTAASNLRASNYGIPVADRQQTKGIAGRIIPAIATTTSAVSGLILLELLKYLQGFNKVTNYRSTFINLAEPVLVYSDPLEAPTIEVGGIKMNSWTKFDYTKDSSLGEFKQYYEQLFGTKINMIVVGTAMIYAEFLSDDEVLTQNISQVVERVLGEVPSTVTVNFGTEDDKDVPSITVQLKKTKNNLMDISV
jgi:ubiquitin-activating enzyme E1